MYGLSPFLVMTSTLYSLNKLSMKSQKSIKLSNFAFSGVKSINIYVALLGLLAPRIRAKQPDRLDTISGNRIFLRLNFGDDSFSRGHDWAFDNMYKDTHL